MSGAGAASTAGEEAVGRLDLDWVQRATELFDRFGAHFVAILLLVVALSLFVMPNRFTRIMGVVAFVAALASGAFAIYAARQPPAEDPNRRYAMIRTLEFHEAVPLVKDVVLPRQFREINAEGYFDRRADRLVLIVLSSRPFPEDGLDLVFLQVEDNQEIPLCIHALERAQRLRLVRRQVSDGTGVIDRLIVQGQPRGRTEWIDLDCN